MEEQTLLPSAACAAPTIEAPAVTKEGARPRTFADLGDERRLKVGLPVYRKVRAIGQGSFGKAYLVEPVSKHRHGQPQTSTQRVLKKMPLRGLSENLREAAFREALLMRRTCQDCPFITQFAEVFLGKAGTVLCLVMEFCSGGDLKTVLNGRDGRRLEEDSVAEWIVQVGHALHHCHSVGVLHRDVKPDNCFFRVPNGDLLLGDFGISCALDERSFAKTCIGSPLYMSPEVVNQERYSFTTDIWSLGVMLYEALVLAPPFKGANVCQLALKIVTSTPEPLPSDFSSAMQSVVLQLLEKDPSKRLRAHELLVAPALQASAAAAAEQHGLSWPPALGLNEARGQRRRGLVKRLRGHVNHSSAVTADKLEGDAVELEDEGEVVYGDASEDDDLNYGDDFEEASDSGASYEADFEEPSDDGSGEEGATGLSEAEELSETQVRMRIREELGEEALAAAENLGLISFLGDIRRAGNVVAAH